MDRYQWTVLFAAWLGWGFDVFDALLFNYVAPNCVPTLLGLPIGSAAAKAATLHYTGIITSLLLVGWAAGGIFFGRLCDRIGRTKTLLLTMCLYAIGTALCAVAPSIGFLVAFRFLASLGIGGEWAAGASMVAEVVPDRRRVEAGAILATAGAVGGFLATYVTYWVQGVAFASSPQTAWRYVFLFGLAPAAVAFVVRSFVEEPERWKNASEANPPGLAELFSPEWRGVTLAGLGLALTALITWWSCNAFISIVATGLAHSKAVADGLDSAGANQLAQEWIKFATNISHVGGLIGGLATVLCAKQLGRRAMYAIYFVLAAASIVATFGLDLAPEVRIYGYFFIGLSVSGVFGSFTYYLPELFPTRLRATGAGFCYNAGRVVAALGPFLVGAVAATGTDALTTAIRVLFWVGLVPLSGLLLMPWVVETRNQILAD